MRSEGLGSEAEVTQLPRQARANPRTQHHYTTRLTPDSEPQLSLLGGPSAGGAEGKEGPSEALPELGATENARTFAEEIALRYEELAQGDQMEPIVLVALGAPDPRNRNTSRPSWAGMLTGVAATLASVNSPINRLTSDLAARDFTRGLDLGPNLGKSVPSAVTLVDEIREPTPEEESLAGFELDKLWDITLSPSFETDDGRDPSATPSKPDTVRSPGPCSALNVTDVTGADEASVNGTLAEEVASWKEGDWSTAKLQGGPLSPAELSETKEEFWARRMGEHTRLEKSEAASTSPKGRPPIKSTNPTTDEVAARLGYSTAFFSYITGGRKVDLKQLAQAELRNDSGSRQPPGPLDRDRALRPMPQPSPPAEARTVTPPSQGDPMDGIPEKFRGTFDFYIMFKDGAAVKRRVEQWERSFISDSLACRKDVAEGRRPKSRFRQVLHITPEEFDDFIKGRHVNCSDPEACFIVSAADQLPPPGVGIDYDAVSADVGDHDFSDQVLLTSSLPYGLDTKSTQPWPGIVLSPFNASAAQRLDLVESAMDKGEEKGWQVHTPAIPSVPFIAEPHSIVFKKHSYDPLTGQAKPRLATDKSFFPGPTVLTDPETGSPLADNANVNVKEMFPPMRLVGADTLRDGAGTLGAIGDVMRRKLGPGVGRAPLPPDELDRACREAAQPYMAVSDFQGYFSQFFMKYKLQCRQGLCFVRGNGKVEYTYSRRCQFGGATAPQFAQRMSNTVLYRLKIEMAEEEERWAKDAEAWEKGEGGSKFAALMSPAPLRELVAKRRELVGKQAAAPYFVEAYIDDVIMCGLGKARTLAMLTLFYGICNRWRIPVAEGKSSFGTECEVIGYLFKLKSGVFSLTPNKLHLLRAWFRRLRGLRGRKVETKEIASLVGTLNWCRTACPQSGRFLRRMFGLANSKRRSVYQRKWMQFDLDQLEDMLAEYDGTALIREPRPPIPIQPDCMLWSDASREPGGDVPSAMGGVIPATGVVWKYDFSKRQTEVLPIHLLEGIGSIVGLAMAAETLRGKAVMAWCDNQSWVKSVQRAKPKDPCLRELLAIQDELARRHELTVLSEYVHTDVNTVSDKASRGDVPGAVAELVARGWSEDQITVIDLNETPALGPPDLELLFKRIIQIYEAKVAVRKGRIAHIWD